VRRDPECPFLVRRPAPRWQADGCVTRVAANGAMAFCTRRSSAHVHRPPRCHPQARPLPTQRRLAEVPKQAGAGDDVDDASGARPFFCCSRINASRGQQRERPPKVVGDHCSILATGFENKGIAQDRALFTTISSARISPPRFSPRGPRLQSRQRFGERRRIRRRASRRPFPHGGFGSPRKWTHAIGPTKTAAPSRSTPLRSPAHAASASVTIAPLPASACPGFISHRGFCASTAAPGKTHPRECPRRATPRGLYQRGSRINHRRRAGEVGLKPPRPAKSAATASVTTAPARQEWCRG